MNLAGSIAEAVGPVLEGAYGSYEDAGGVGSSVLDTVIGLPRLVTVLLLEAMSYIGADVGSGFGA